MEIFGFLVNSRGKMGNKIYLVKRESSMQSRHDRLMKRSYLQREDKESILSNYQNIFLARTLGNVRKKIVGRRGGERRKMLWMR